MTHTPRRATAALALTLALAETVTPCCACADPVTDPRVVLLERDATQARVWWWGFTIGYSVAGVAQTVMALALDDEGLRIDAAVGAVSTWLGVGGMLLSPIPAVWRAADDARRTGRVDEALARAADAEATGRAWYNHAACVVVALAAGAVLWWGYDRPGSAALNATANLVVGEVNLWTQPARALHLRDRAGLHVHLAPSLNGLQLVGTW